MIKQNKIPFGWTLEEFGNFVRKSSDKYNPVKERINYKCLELEHFEQETGKINGWTKSEMQASIKNKFNKGEVLFGKLRPYLRKFWFAEFNGVCSSEVWVLNGVKNKCENKYLFYLIQQHRFIETCNMTTGSKMPRADWHLVEEEPFLLPPIPEQRKIAKLLGKWDEIIEIQTKLIEAKEGLRKGLMQKVLSSEIRFSEFEDRWQEKLIEDIAKIKTGNKDTQNKVKSGKYPFFVRSQTIERINSYSFDGEAVLTSGDGVGVGKIYHYLNGKFDYHQRVYNIHSFNRSVLGKYFYYYFSENFYERVMAMSAKNSVDSIRLEMIAKMEIPIPSLAEQKKISGLLSACDNEIEILKKELIVLKSQQKGLMQQLLTGKIRL